MNVLFKSNTETQRSEEKENEVKMKEMEKQKKKDLIEGNNYTLMSKPENSPLKEIDNQTSL